MMVLSVMEYVIDKCLNLYYGNRKALRWSARSRSLHCALRLFQVILRLPLRAEPDRIIIKRMRIDAEGY